MPKWSENGVRIQIAVALIAFLLLRLAYAVRPRVEGLLAFTRLVRTNLMHRYQSIACSIRRRLSLTINASRPYANPEADSRGSCSGLPAAAARTTTHRSCMNGAAALSIKKSERGECNALRQTAARSKVVFDFDCSPCSERSFEKYRDWAD